MKNNDEELMQLISKQLDEMQGKYFEYGNAKHRIDRYHINEERGRVIITTDRKQYDRPLDAALEFLNLFEPVAERSISVMPQSPGYQLPEKQINGSVIKELKDILMDNINKVKADKNYIPQAQAVKENVDAIIEL